MPASSPRPSSRLITEPSIEQRRKDAVDAFAASISHLTAVVAPEVPMRLWSDPSATFKFNCGCGYRTASYRDAHIHADTSGHSMTISGDIRVTKFV